METKTFEVSYESIASYGRIDINEFEKAISDYYKQIEQKEKERKELEESLEKIGLDGLL